MDIADITVAVVEDIGGTTVAEWTLAELAGLATPDAHGFAGGRRHVELATLADLGYPDRHQFQIRFAHAIVAEAAAVPPLALVQAEAAGIKADGRRQRMVVALSHVDQEGWLEIGLPPFATWASVFVRVYPPGTKFEDLFPDVFP